MGVGASDISSAAAFSVAELEYALPAERIAQTPLAERDPARLLVLDRASGTLQDRRVRDLPDFLRPGDLLVLNNTKVLPAKFHARRKTGGGVPGLFIEQESIGVWRVMLEGSKRLKLNESLVFDCGPDCGVELLLEQRLEEGHWRVRVVGTLSRRDVATLDASTILAVIGETPLPPYIHRSAPFAHRLKTGATQDAANVPEQPSADRDRYQTIFAERPGAIAAPTAGLHFTDELLDRCRSRGIETAFVTLHVGVGTFKPIAVDDLCMHRMHAERYELPASTAAVLAACRRRGGRVVAVGTTSVRVLETCADVLDGETPKAHAGETDIFIYPPYRFRAVDALLTNFHLPRSTLLALVMAFGGIERIRAAYAHAIENEYRFYSYGDAMLIL